MKNKWEYIKVVVDDLPEDYKDDWEKVQQYLDKGYEIFQITSATAGADSKWIRHFFWLRKLNPNW